ncbi:type IV pili methyl-accepting chemotaxis transducer N-terminal domain-containing protein [Eikenella sp. S3360]|uniref:Sensor protein n=1 Tax=Eikenella glucosivorans TaxID=2766967 RepID=A0ABS0N851_9NEIS|nr:type IV pili methyl-accepting chemotaxis transducer N-terminal domain-containing protein [Eikenella glucosivorans]MBH5328485.1 type IV pili methyl-accepting chemotaxis transducer N-terminal domain-containing protein [Eikenella glucosivorans]
MKLLKSLSVRLKLLTLLWLVLAAASSSYTLLLSWRLEGSAAAINDIGSLRLRSYRIALLIRENAPAAEIEQRLQQYDGILANVRQGDRRRPLFLPPDDIVWQRFNELDTHWQQSVRPRFQVASQQHKPITDQELQPFLNRLDSVVSAVEQTNTRYISWLRLFQSSLLVLVAMSAAFMIFLLYWWIIRPLQHLQQGVAAIHGGQLGIQIPIDHSSEFARVDNGFNQMSSRLSQLYSHLEEEVAEKTRDLEAKHHTLETLYFFSHFLSQTQTTAGAAEVFLKRMLEMVSADAGSIRLIDFKRQRMDLVTQIGLPDSLQTAEACQRFDDCLCGHAVMEDDWQPIRFVRDAEKPNEGQNADIDGKECSRLGFSQLRIFKIRYKAQDFGMVTLYFKQKEPVAMADSDLWEALCSQFGVVISNLRLIDESRQLAVLQERNLIAQGLHDSIAQALTFLNLQVQMLEAALQNHEQEQINENLQYIKEGIQECYDDVRELLSNFRTKINSKDFAGVVQALVERFERQTQIAVRLSWHGNGPPLSNEQQLQVVFILQESLSNVRKHSQASQVDIRFDNGQDFTMSIQDDGCGFDTERIKEQHSHHVGLHIMRERASRIRAELGLQSAPGGTRVTLKLPNIERRQV